MGVSKVMNHYNTTPMAQLYTENPLNSEQLIPRNETIRFLLDYSKALYVVEIDSQKLDCLLN